METPRTIPEVFSQAADHLENRDGEAIERLANSLRGWLIPEDEWHAYTRTLNAMAAAAYELAEADL